MALATGANEVPDGTARRGSRPLCVAGAIEARRERGRSCRLTTNAGSITANRSVARSKNLIAMLRLIADTQSPLPVLVSDSEDALARPHARLARRFP